MQKEKRPVLDVVISETELPQAVEDLFPLRVMGETALRVVRQRYKHINTLSLGRDERSAVLKDAAIVFERLIAVEARIGQMLADIPRERVAGPGRGNKIGTHPECRTRSLLQEAERHVGGHRRAQEAMLIWKHSAIAKDLVREAFANEDIPSRAGLVRRIRDEIRPRGTQVRNSGKTLVRRLKGFSKTVSQIGESWDELDHAERWELNRLIARTIQQCEGLLSNVSHTVGSGPADEPS